ncbi:hypothetical protein M8J76_008289 [Diaphorina citri]|nr:hypothetical protein M8J76_008289 [Diaphorina citri]KAI5747299.1 hypothetical protein M8J77_013201 [Diaphorina citri]
MERMMYFNMYLTMKHYEQMKYHPTYLPLNILTREHEVTGLTADPEDFKRAYSTPVAEMPEGNADDSKMDSNDGEEFDYKSDMDSRSSTECNESNEEVDTNCSTENSNSNENATETNSQHHKTCKHSIHAPTRHTDFSIERILSQDNRFKQSSSHFNKFEEQYNEFDWLKCTRYKPPKIHRLRKKEAPKKRTPGCNPRIPFSESTLRLMEAKYQESPYITGENLKEFARNINVSKERIVVWFQNRRARQRREEETRQPVCRPPNRTGSNSSNSDHCSASARGQSFPGISPMTTGGLKFF